MRAFAALALATGAIALHPLVDEDVLEPSIQNEVDHARGVAPTNAPPRAEWSEDFRLFCTTNDFFGTNGLSATEVAIRLVSAQKADGRWYYGTNDVTAVALDILESL